MGRAIIIINRYPPSPGEVSEILEALPVAWKAVRTEEDAGKNRTRLVIDGPDLPDMDEEFTSAAALIEAVARV